jgi:hypothetical protein
MKETRFLVFCKRGPGPSYPVALAGDKSANVCYDGNRIVTTE